MVWKLRLATYMASPMIIDDSSEEKPLKLVPGLFYIPKDRRRVKPLGDDAHFLCTEKQTIGLADGVGGWETKGVDAGEFARNLMSNSLDAVRLQPTGRVDPKEVMRTAFSNTNAKGSSTACIITLENQKLVAAIIGDSAFMVVREGQVIFKSPIQLHSFNCPYQLGKASSSDTPSSAQKMEVKVKSGDVLIAGTDGLFDNMFDNQICAMTNEGKIGGLDPEQLAWALAENAYYISYDTVAFTPFTEAQGIRGRASSSFQGQVHYGGKIDDITVIVAYITDA